MKRKSAQVYRMGRIEPKKVRAAKRRVPLFLIAILVVLLGGGVQSLQATVVSLSQYVSDGVNPPPAEQLDALFDFSVSGSTLTLTVTNLTPEVVGVDPELKINQLYFNTSANVAALTLDSAIHSAEGSVINKWPLTFDEDNIQVNGFGLYDVSLIDGQGNQPDVIGPGEDIVFTMTVNNGIGSFLDSDFIQLSLQVDGHIITVAAAKFYNGLPEMSAYGASVPEPTTICMLVLGGLLLRRRKLSNVS